MSNRTKKRQFAAQRLCLAIILTLLLGAFAASAQENFNRAEFAARRAKVFEKIGDGTAIVFANEKHRYAVKFRQSPDFYYLTGIEEPDAILVLSGAQKRSFVFARRRAPWQKTV